MSNNKRSGCGCSGCFGSFMFMILIIILCVVIVNISEPGEVIDSEYDPDDDIISLDSDDETDDDIWDTDDTNPPDTDTPDTEAPDTDAPDNNNPSGDDGMPEGEFLYYYEQLNDTEKTVYKAMLKALENNKNGFTLKKINYADYGPAIKNAIVALTYDKPIYFWVTNGYDTTYYDRVGTTNDQIDFTFRNYEYWDYTMSPEKYMAELQREVDKAVALAKKYKDPFEQAVFVHDYLVHHAEYDYDALEESEKTIHAASSEYIYSAYGCLVNKKTVCSGYAEAFQLIMNGLGVNTTVVVGDAGGPHEWNAIELGGKMYYVDVTWDDSDRKNDSGVFIYTDDSEYEYMCITTDELEKTHAPDREDFTPPLCDSTEYNYFIRMGYYLEAYSFEEFEDIVERQAQTKKIISIRFATKAEFDKAVKTIIEENRGFEISVLSDGYSYNIDEKHYTIKFLL